MRSRIFALLILIVFLFVPGYLFWYFIYTKKSSLIFIAPSNVSFRVTLSGKFWFSYFPLFDKVFSYESQCTGSCILSPIPPLHYDGYIDSPNSMRQKLSLNLSLDEELKIPLDLSPLLSFKHVATLIWDDLNLIDSLIIEAQKSLSWKLVPLWQSRGANVLAWQNGDSRSLIWEVWSGWFVPYFSLPFPLLSGSLDLSKSAYILHALRGEKFLVSLDGKIRVPYALDMPIVSANLWSTITATTRSGSYVYEDATWRENPRFTMFLDINDTIRIGYIDKDDREKRALSNIQDSASLFFLVDRITGDISPLFSWKDIEALIFYDGMPACIDVEGKIFIISYT